VILIILWALRLNISPTAPSSSHYKNICDLLDKARVSNTEGLLLMLVFSLDLILSLGGPRNNPWLSGQLPR